MKAHYIKGALKGLLLVTAIYSTSASALVLTLGGRPILPGVLGGINLLNNSVNIGGSSLGNSIVGICLGNCSTNNSPSTVQLSIGGTPLLSVLNNQPSTVSPVPEVETIAMISLGLAVVGYQIRRRKLVSKAA